MKYSSEDLERMMDKNGVLDISGKGLRGLMELPKGLRKLCCQDNNLITFPNLPEGLKELYCYNNKLRELPPLPKGLILFSCFNNNLVELPILGENLEYLNCSGNPLKYNTFDLDEIREIQFIELRKKKLEILNGLL